MPDKLAVLQTEESIKELERFNEKLNETIEQFNKLVPLVDKTNSLLTKGTPKEYLEGLKEQKEAQKQINETRKKAVDIALQIANAEKRLSQVKSKEAVELQQIKVQTQEVNKANKQQAKEILGLITPYQKFVQQVNEAKNRAKNLHAEMLQLEQDFKNGIMPANQYKKELNRLSNEYAEAKIKASGLDVQLKNIDKSVGDHQRNVGNYSSAIRGLGGSLSSLAGAFGVGLGISAFAQVLQSSYGTIKELNSQNYALKEVFETEAQVAHQKEYLSEITNKYGLELVSTTEAYTKFSAAIKNTNIEGEEGRKIFTAFSVASSKLGLSANEQAGIFKALEQMMSKAPEEYMYSSLNLKSFNLKFSLFSIILFVFFRFSSSFSQRRLSNHVGKFNINAHKSTARSNNSISLIIILIFTIKVLLFLINLCSQKCFLLLLYLLQTKYLDL